MRDNPFLRRAVENLYVQIAFHVAGGTGLGLFLASWLRQEASLVLGVTLVGVAVLGHWYAVWSDPENRKNQK